MDNPAATLHCPNTRCQAANPPSNRFCQRCRTPLLKRYLWAIGREIEAYKPGDMIGDRYLLVRSSVLLDTQPALPPETPQQIPQSIAPYLQLSPYRLHLPQVYGRLLLPIGGRYSEIWLLEDAPIYIGATSVATTATDSQGQLLPELTSVWKEAPAMRQLNWLWQLASLWQPLSNEGVALSLLTPELLRVEGSIIRLLELQVDKNNPATLQKLGQLWSQLMTGASPIITGFLKKLCTQLVEGQIRTAEELVGLLDQALKDCGRSQTRSYQIFTRTDAGPSRPHNEDACYPPAGQLIRPSTDAEALAIVCDGIGGHEGGEIASKLAIDTLRESGKNQSVDLNNWNPTTITLELEQAACAANDAISSLNDSENRSDRQRMGTTLVMARAYAHEIYITHVGDSRIYWVTRSNCYQVTQDDDLASREVRLGYALYRSAVQQPTSGSLVQALGMAPSATLHPTVQRFVLDEDCVFLLCSDGLSDNDRVEQYWQTEILSILEGQIDLVTAAGRLVEIANTQNGHDNVTVALVHCKVTSSQETGQTQLLEPNLEALPAPVATAVQAIGTSAAPSRMKTQQLPVRGSTQRPWGLLLGILILLGLGGVLSYLLIPGVSSLVDPLISSDSSPSPTPLPANSSVAPSSESPSVEPSSSDLPALIQVLSSTAKNSQGKAVPLLLRRGLPPQNQAVVGVIPAGSILQVINKSLDQQQDSWLQLRVCSPGSSSDAQQPASAKTAPKGSQSPGEKSPAVSKSKPTSVTYRPVGQGDSGWLREADVQPLLNPNFTSISVQQSGCIASTPPPVSTSTPRDVQSP